MDHGTWNVDRGPWTVDRGPWTVNHGPWTMDRGGIGGPRRCQAVSRRQVELSAPPLPRRLGMKQDTGDGRQHLVSANVWLGAGQFMAYGWMMHRPMPGRGKGRSMSVGAAATAPIQTTAVPGQGAGSGGAWEGRQVHVEYRTMEA
ncbi:hypothetical protein M433DRAFT_156723 [Acidomyces richmondensis BFW]|nr:MAG: hypothetical protein FE78DRAFT_93703 [Acidomyces sp. 'richmondensis']KYG43472.1 hypothetical protein M433DRAFT_156723 [Acidomyces richmondensis BFW]